MIIVYYNNAQQTTFLSGVCTELLGCLRTTFHVSGLFRFGVPTLAWVSPCHLRRVGVHSAITPLPAPLPSDSSSRPLTRSSVSVARSTRSISNLKPARRHGQSGLVYRGLGLPGCRARGRRLHHAGDAGSFMRASRGGALRAGLMQRPSIRARAAGHGLGRTASELRGGKPEAGRRRPLAARMPC